MSTGPVSSEGKTWAIVSYAGLFFGLPLSIIPLILRNDDFALHHGKKATGVFIGWLIATVVIGGPIACVTFGLGALLLPLFWLWPLAVGIHGLILSLNEDWADPIGSFGIGDQLFGSITAQPQIPSSPEAPSPPPTDDEPQV